MALRMPLLLLLFFLLAPASSKFGFFFPNVKWVDQCEYFAPNTTSYNALTELAIFLDESVDHYFAARTFEWLFCINRLSTGKGLNVTISSTGQRMHVSDDPMWRFYFLFDENGTRSKDACKTAAESGLRALVFTERDDRSCSDNNTFTLQLDTTVPRNYSGPCPNQTQEEPNRYRIYLQPHCGIRKLHELAFRLGDSPVFNGSGLSIISTVAERYLDETVSLAVPKTMLAVAVLASMLISILIFFFCLITLVNVNEHFLCIMEQLIRARVRRQRALMREERDGEEGLEEGEEAVEQRPNRRRRLNSEEQSLLGTDESTIRTALSGRFSSLNSLSFHSAESRPRRESLDSSLDEVVVVENSDDVTTADSRTETDKSKQGGK